MLTNKEYEQIAKKMMASRKIKFTDELFSEVCLALMIADRKFNPEIGNIEGFRKYYVDCYIKNYFRSQKKYYNRHCHLSDEVVAQTVAPEKTNYDMVDFLENSNLSERKKRIIKQRFWEKKNLQEIADDENVSSEAVRQTINSAMKEIRNEFKKQNIESL